VAPGALVVCVLTGNGLKDPDTATSSVPPPPVVEADLDTLADAILGQSVAGGTSSR
jgi:threonine synthase